jgi:hypothetical protein
MSNKKYAEIQRIEKNQWVALSLLRDDQMLRIAPMVSRDMFREAS